MHAREWIAALDNLRFGGREFLQAAGDNRVVRELFGEPYIGGMVPRLGLEQGLIELRKFRFPLLDMFGQQTEPFATSRLDQPGDQQSIDGSIRIVGAHQAVQFFAIVSRRLASKRNVTLL